MSETAAANVGIIVDLFGGLYASPWSMSADVVGSSTVEMVRAGILLSHFAYMSLFIVCCVRYCLSAPSPFTHSEVAIQIIFQAGPKLFPSKEYV